MKTNPYIKMLLEREGDEDIELEELSPLTLATLAVVHELAEANALNAPPRITISTGEMSEEDFTGPSGRIMAIPDESGDARIAAAARRWAEAYGRRNTPGAGPASHLAASELLEAVRQEGER